MVVTPRVAQTDATELIKGKGNAGVVLGGFCIVGVQIN
jgi:hypothetical protein